MDKNLACSGSKFNIDNLIFYERKIPYLEILKILRKYEERQVTEDVERLKNIKIALEGGVINLCETAEKYSVKRPSTYGIYSIPYELKIKSVNIS